MNKLVSMGGTNFGDALNPILYKFISGTDSDHRKIGCPDKCYMMIGSILNKAQPKTIVWGAGVAQDHGNINLKCNDVRAVRGPISRDFLLENGVECPEVYGDPALLISRYYTPSVEKEYKLGIIPHVLDFPYVGISCDSINIIDLNKPYYKIIDEMNKCESIISSSLHGLIVADAYGIPNKWVEFSDRVLGNGLKFRDYYQSIGYNDETPLNLKKISNYLIKNILTEVSRHDINLDMDALYESCPFKQ